MNLAKKIVGTAFLLVATGSVMAQNLAVVNGVPIPMSRFESVVSAILPSEPTEEQRQAIKGQMINLEIAEQAAKAQKLDKDPAFKARIGLARAELLTQMLVQKYLQSNPVSQAEIQAAYNAAKGSVPPEYETQHILTKTKKEADAILAKLKAGGNFAELAKTMSQDSGTAVNGGNLGWAPATNYVPAFAQAVTALQKGQVSATPVQTQFGFHIIKVKDVRTPEIPPLDQVQPQLVEQLTQQKAGVYLDGLIATAKVQ